LRAALPVLQVMFLTLAGSVAGQAQPVRFAVAPGFFTGDAGAVEWLGAGVAFDVEKRLERWPAVQSADSLQALRALKGVNLSDERAAAKALLGQLELDAAITFTGRCTDGKLDLQARVWTNASSSSDAIQLQGSLSELFVLHDRLVDGLVSQLRSAFPKLQAPDKTVRLHIAPAKSVEAYELVIRGMAALQNGSPRSARPILEKACERDPDLWWGRYFLGAVEFHEGSFGKAIEHCQAAIKLDPDLYAGVYANLAYCYQAMADKERFQWAKDEFERRTGKSLPDRALPTRGIGFGTEVPKHHVWESKPNAQS